jgi:inner membrane protein
MRQLLNGWDERRILPSRRLLAGSLLAIFAVDVFLWATAPPLILDGLTDWAAHAATVILMLGVIGEVSATFAAGALAGGVLIDLDHIPQYLGTEFLTEGTPRPYTHSLLTVILLGLAAWRSRGELHVFLAGASIGLVSHLIRDMAEPGQNGGVALLWPLSDWGVTIPYVVYGAAVMLLFLGAWRRYAGASVGSAEAAVRAVAATAASVEEGTGE